MRKYKSYQIFFQNDVDLARKNLYIKYGDMPHYAEAEMAFSKQKHRMIWERRHGEVGSGMSAQ